MSLPEIAWLVYFVVGSVYVLGMMVIWSFFLCCGVRALLRYGSRKSRLWLG